ncbi:MAG: carbohydrate ABC transporter permease [Synergistales bacterium]|nr:carbohydrate ABC transporter permease [Synergistales bacterium]
MAGSLAARRRRLIGRILTYIFLSIFGIFFAFPLFWTFSSSLQTWQELRSYIPHLLPSVPQWGNYAKVFQIIPFHRWMLNSLTIIAIAVPGAIITSTMVAYAFARFNFPEKNIWFIILLGTMMIPSQVTFIPQYILFFRLKLVNTYAPLTLGSWLGGGAFNIFLLRQFIMSIPRDLDEAAIIDGAGPFRILWQVLVPLMRPALTTVAILGFQHHWNDFFGPFIYLTKPNLFTAAIGVRYFKLLPMEGGEPKDHLLMASAAIMTIPVLIVFAAAQQYFVSGVVMTGLKF